ncbi:MAG: hypothetical protein J7K73_01815 [Nanoarchaeota archaeon]|nr:hypothetical protein [Nanoarchaeota archaeon]
MIEDIIRKYGKIVEKDGNTFLLETSGFDIESLEKELGVYSVEIVEQKGSLVRIKLKRDLLKEFQNQIKKYNEDVPPEDLRYMDD